MRVGTKLSYIYMQEEGVPQGCVLCVTHFALKVNYGLCRLPLSVQGSLYVDDLQILCQGKQIWYVERHLQTAMNKIQNSCLQNGFRFSTEKPSCVHICHLCSMHPDSEIDHATVAISILDTVNFLGVIYDRKLTFRPHIDTLCRIFEQWFNMLKFLTNTCWGADRPSFLRIYNSNISPNREYGCAAYESLS